MHGAWLNLALKRLPTISEDDLQSAPIGEEYAVEDKDELGNDSVWRRSILQRKDEDEWQLWDETKNLLIEADFRQLFIVQKKMRTRKLMVMRRSVVAQILLRQKE